MKYPNSLVLTLIPILLLPIYKTLQFLIFHIQPIFTFIISEGKKALTNLYHLNSDKGTVESFISNFKMPFVTGSVRNANIQTSEGMNSLLLLYKDLNAQKSSHQLLFLSNA